MINNSADRVHLVPRPDDQPSDDAAIGTRADVVRQVRQALDEARQTGQPVPGRPTLVRMTGATEHAIRKALAELAHQDGGAGASRDQRIGDGGIRPVPDHAAAAIPPPADTEPDGRLRGAGATGGGLSPTTSPMSAPSPPGGRLVAWTGFVFGSVMSIAANVLHAWLPAGHEPPGWSPGIAPQVGAAVWPIGLMLAVEALSRVRWPKGLGWAWPASVARERWRPARRSSPTDTCVMCCWRGSTESWRRGSALSYSTAS